MKVAVVSTGGPRCVASACLEAEGVEHQVYPVTGDFGYAELLKRLWKDGGFVLLEDDIAPTPGAVHELLVCGGDYCAFDYPIGRGIMVASCAHMGLGILKVSDRLAIKYPHLSVLWSGVSWRQLDKAVHDAIRSCQPSPTFHLHRPAVAHAQGYRP